MTKKLGRDPLPDPLHKIVVANYYPRAIDVIDCGGKKAAALIAKAAVHLAAENARLKLQNCRLHTTKL